VEAAARPGLLLSAPALVPALSHDPLKMAARLQAEGTQGGPYFLLPLPGLGTRRRHHADGALVEQDVDELSFYCWALDVAPPWPGEASPERQASG
jgi:prolyl oligopeptidase